MKLLKPFRLDENKNLVINHDSLRGIEPFATLIRRVKKMKGDHDGRKKMLNLRELKYIYFMCDYSSYHRGLLPKQKKIKAKEDAGLPDNWKPDSVVESCIEKYNEIVNHYIPSAKTLIALESSLSQTGDIVISYITQNQELIETISKLKEEMQSAGTLDPVLIASIGEVNNLLRANLKDTLSISKNLPDTIDGLERLQEKVRKEEGSVKQLPANKQKRNREDPD